MKDARQRRHSRIRKKISGTKDNPRMSVYRSLKNIYVQLIDDENSQTILTCSTLNKGIKDKCKGANVKSATVLGELVAKQAKEKGVEKVVFDRGGYLYHGCIKAVAESARKGGLIF